MGKDDTESVKNNKHVNAVRYDCLPQHHATGTGDGTATWQASASFVHQRLCMLAHGRGQNYSCCQCLFQPLDILNLTQEKKEVPVWQTCNAL